MRRRGLRRFLLPAALFGLAGMVGLVAIGDHRWKERRSNHAQLLEWYCVHERTRCGGPSSVAIERHWNQREFGYELAVVTVAGAALALGAARALRG
jgi:hypothetical protein